MKKNKSCAWSSFRLPLVERKLWDVNKLDYDCDCSGPPPQFYLPPPPRPSSLDKSDCSENSFSYLKICETVPMIDAEHHYRPIIPSLAIILTVVVVAVVVVFLLFGTFLVALKKRKMQNLFLRKSSPPNLCDTVSANGIIYEDLTNVRSRTLSSHCPPSQTTLPLLEMIDVSSCSSHAVFAPVFVCSASPTLHLYKSQELFNPVYEELSTGSGEKGETESEETFRAGVSGDEFAEDELSYMGRANISLKKGRDQDDDSQHEFFTSYFCRDLDSSDADDRSKFLENSERDLNMPFDHCDKRKRRNKSLQFCRGSKKPKCPSRKKMRKNKPSPTLPTTVVDCNEFREGFLLEKILQIYPDVRSIGLQFSRKSSIIQRSEVHSLGENLCESFATFEAVHSHRDRSDVFSTFGEMQNSVKNKSQDSSLESDSGYSNNTSGGKSSSKSCKKDAAPNHSNPVLS